MMNQGGGGGGGGSGGSGHHGQMGNNYHGGHGGQRGGIQNRLNFNAQNAEPVAVEPMPHKQVGKRKIPPMSLTSLTVNSLSIEDGDRTSRVGLPDRSRHEAQRQSGTVRELPEAIEGNVLGVGKQSLRDEQRD